MSLLIFKAKTCCSRLRRLQRRRCLRRLQSRRCSFRPRVVHTVNFRMGGTVPEPDLSAETGPACVLGCLAVCLLLLLRAERASRVSGELHGCKPRGARGVCALRRAACRCLPRTAYHGLTRGVCRTALLLMLVSWLGGCDAAGTICSNEPTACDGTYSYTSLCAPLPRLPCATNERRGEEGVAQLGCQG